MEELIARVTQATGLDAETAERAIGIILAFLKKEGPPDEVFLHPKQERTRTFVSKILR